MHVAFGYEDVGNTDYMQVCLQASASTVGYVMDRYGQGNQRNLASLICLTPKILQD